MASRDPTQPPDDELAALLAAYDEALARGTEPASLDASSSKPLRSRLELDLPLLHMLNQLRPSRQSAGSAALELTLEEFADQLTLLGLVPESESALLVKQMRKKHPSPTAVLLGQLLVDQRRLTPLQFDRVLRRSGASLVLGEYLLTAEIGAGGMGAVFRAVHRRMNRVVAVKMIQESFLQSPELVARFHREVQTAAALAHPNIVAAHDAGESNGRRFLVMEYIDGPDLATLVHEGGVLPMDAAIDYVIQAAEGLAYAHGLGVVHRDIKPHNLLLDPSGTVKILDMGLARYHKPRSTGGNSTTQTRLTRTGEVVGTYDYMSPEQAVSSKEVDERTDIYSLGCTLYFLLVGSPPYPEAAPLDIVLAHRQAPIPSLLAVRPDVSEKLDAAFRRMMAKSAAERYPSMRAVIDALRDARGGTDAPAIVSLWLVRWRAIAAAALALGGGLIWMAMSAPRNVQSPAAIAATATTESTTSSATQSTTPSMPTSALLSVDSSPQFADAPFDEVLAKRHQTQWANYLQTEVVRTNVIGMKLVLVPPGSFVMGTSLEELQTMLMSRGEVGIERFQRELPPHPVRIASPYYLGMHEVTVGQFEQFVAATNYVTNAEEDGTGLGREAGQWSRDPSYTWREMGDFPIADDHPVSNVSWNDATAFCRWLSETDCSGCRLPTEAEWEFACRAGSQSLWSFGASSARMAEFAWFEANGNYRFHPVGQKRANAFGFFDMYGNEWERCADFYAADYFANSPVEDPKGPPTGYNHMLRGGNCVLSAIECRSASRRWNHPRAPDNGGFRIAQEVDR